MILSFSKPFTTANPIVFKIPLSSNLLLKIKTKILNLAKPWITCMMKLSVINVIINYKAQTLEFSYPTVAATTRDEYQKRPSTPTKIITPIILKNIFLFSSWVRSAVTMEKKTPNNIERRIVWRKLRIDVNTAVTAIKKDTRI